MAQSRLRAHNCRESEPADPKYMCEAPRFPPGDVSRGIPQLSKRHKELHIPADLCRLKALWADSLPGTAVPKLTSDVGFSISQVGAPDISCMQVKERGR